MRINFGRKIQNPEKGEINRNSDPENKSKDSKKGSTKLTGGIV